MNYPQWICRECGVKYGHRECGVATWHRDKCDVCGKETMVTEPRDYGHLKEEWLGAVWDV
jgi:rRNA maturation protein Nop10